MVQTTERTCQDCGRPAPRASRCPRCASRRFRERHRLRAVDAPREQHPERAHELEAAVPAPDAFTGAVCAGDDRWTSDDVATRRAVAPLCAGCPALEACTRRAGDARPRWGVWAGRDYSARPRTTDGREGDAVPTRAAS